MGFNIDKVTVCRRCGALLLPEMQEKHQEFHQAVLNLAEASANTNGSITNLLQVVRTLNSRIRVR